MEKTILTKHQATILDHLSWEKDVHENFYLSGGTALAEFYLHHRLSEDLDFFSEKEFDPQVIQVVLKKIQKKVKLKKIDFQQSFNRNLFFLSIGNDIVKTEFTYFPFSPITNGMNYNELRIDSLLDIAVNKVFTIYQKPRSRDFIDLYCILQKERWPFENLIKKAKIKFDWHVDPVQMGSQLMKVNELKDFPHMTKKIRDSEWQKFFLKKAEELAGQIFKK
ncbi:MAG: hypothetical protein A3B74_02410 [Candidatus Kerfeldbacteria bacterium RIFCSPHIGHO2_02_FULL_42_14]|uniref:Nucleotidyl transferase AbiEii/AbiGii toxin family protein n=1 Tax=Candidatus Kerfeldbacteria bacterium RIFCSPHIGHO2_02_FULL_42_14 TaxID=1798540 RepID=A0A1G2ARU3_9BACT|nr:MAG: hypothetical protein A3B74_02410 [Candidatus Kerfeldbacteria bacterium RIFCSPHIGHO2_02_FULL_42_14]OGY80397.1 MAG: hypothetical protein A3E60_05030 [Candidatus Kerfeldbacteria bacterium RIFCSPHIGHO2_12_FULL_42_13]OGY83826.1 MAG: hypothetical protein A3I91_04555 [Candidatus Kerfeldbacteria bacterium RIFCSPLOWO2_02_FULL_42_19]OGY85400.1 MAG: hypothetical protein A3G01_02310 [Candidatus Kerfeldbacteria bacterium RIFCSPLOWO2_12_FULL_43_9]